MIELSINVANWDMVAQDRVGWRAAILMCAVSVSAQDDIVVPGKAHTRSAPSLSSLPKVSLETVPIFFWLNTDHS